jgi:hypothetical protein
MINAKILYFYAFVSPAGNVTCLVNRVISAVHYFSLGRVNRARSLPLRRLRLLSPAAALRAGQGHREEEEPAVPVLEPRARNCALPS